MRIELLAGGGAGPTLLAGVPMAIFSAFSLPLLLETYMKKKKFSTEETVSGVIDIGPADVSSFIFFM